VAYLANRDESTTLPGGARITCQQIGTEEGIRAAWHAWRYMLKIGVP
jgi:hypothetical protein